MKKKTINKVLETKINEWLNSIEDETLRKWLKPRVIVTGGCIASMLLKEKVNDYDIYFTDIDAVRAVANHYVKKFQDRAPISPATGTPTKFEVHETNGRISIFIKSAGIAGGAGATEDYRYFEMMREGAAGDYVDGVMGPGDIEDLNEEIEEKVLSADDSVPYRPVFMSSNAITLSNKIQIILRFYGPPNEIHKNYDFVHCTNYWTFDTGTVLNLPAMESLMSKELRYVGSLYPLCSIIRLRKFIRREWTVNAGQILKMIMQCNDLNLKDPAVLQDQLTGVDAAYFIEIMHKVRQKDPEKINSAYLIEIIDRMF